MIKIEFPADRQDIALALGHALVGIGQGAPVLAAQFERAVAGPQATSAPAETPARVAPADDEQTSDTLPEVDANGVPFDDAMCARAKEPFYTSGPQKGQWKKRKGVSEDDYNKWYAVRRSDPHVTANAPYSAANALTEDQASADLKALAAAPAQATVEVEIDPAAAFDPPAPAAQAFAPQATAAPAAPATTGELMKWISEHQVAKRVTQDDVNAAYREAGVGVMDLFPSATSTPEKIAANVAAVYHALLPKVAA